MEVANYVIRSHVRPWGRRWTWLLVAANSEPVAQSEPYATEAAAQEGIRAVRRIAANALGPDRVETWIERSLATDAANTQGAPRGGPA